MAASHNPSLFGTPQLNEYDYVRFLTRSRIAWEYRKRLVWLPCLRPQMSDSVHDR